MSARLSTVAVACMLASAGCTSSRTLTPWLRVYAYHPFELIAESGSHARGDAWIERRVGGRWIVSREFSIQGFGFARGERAVLGDKLLTRDGRTIDLGCDHRGIGNGLRVTPRGELVCVEVRTWLDRDVPADARETTRVLRYDDDGHVIADRVVPLPVPRPADAPPLASSIDTGLVGFLGNDLVYSVLVTREHESWASDVIKEATAYALDANSHWRALGTMRFRAIDVWMLHSPRRWSEALGVRVERGIAEEGGDGWVSFAMRFSGADGAIDAITRLADEHGLVLMDPQEGAVYRPGRE